MSVVETIPSALLDTIRLPDHVLSRMLADLAAASPVFDHELPLRSHDYASLPRMVIRIHSPATGDWLSYLIRPHSLHPNGAAFLLGTFLYPSVRCGLLLRRDDGNATQVFGAVRACQHAAGRIHDIRIQFDVTLNLRDYQLPQEIRHTPLLRHHA
ncbi:MAG TPA: hypothetical protein VG711_08475 [Phycisphaerales bacterium]|nr:hypothetical protein [Phycisphaerales bacterium]